MLIDPQMTKPMDKFTGVLTAKDISQKNYLELPRETSVYDAARQMSLKGSQFAVVAATGSLEGMVTEWDIVSKVLAEGKNPKKVKLGDIMSAPLIVVDANQPIDEVAQLMTRKKIRRVLVLFENELYGVVTSNSVMARLKEYIDSLSNENRKQGLKGKSSTEATSDL